MPYESKPMKKQWVEVDGKMTPIILPQIWSHEKQDWVVTSEQNPLPTQVTGSKVELVEIATGMSVASGATVYPGGFSNGVDILGVNEVTVIARVYGHSGVRLADYELSIIPLEYLESGVFLDKHTKSTSVDSGSVRNLMLARIKVDTGRMRIRYVNNTPEQIIIDVTMLKFY